MRQAHGPSLELAEFVAAARATDLPEAVFAEAKRCLVNYFAAALAGARDPDVNRLFKVSSSLSGRGEARVVGRGEAMAPLLAAFLNAAAANVHDFDDTHPSTTIQPTAPVAAALFALVETDRLPGRVSGFDLLAALALGIEVECRIGDAVSSASPRRGGRLTASCGIFGAAAAAGWLLGLDAERMLWAFGGAAAQSSGLAECLGTGAKSVGVGGSARSGMLAALLAQAGLDGPAAPLEGACGFLSQASPAPRLEALTEGLGERWSILLNTYQPYPCVSALNPVIEACLALGGEHGVAPGAVESVEIAGPAQLAECADRPDPGTRREAQISAQHAAAVSIAAGRAGIAEFSDAALRDPAVSSLRARVALRVDVAIPVGAAAVTIRLRDGRALALRIDEPLGSLARPLSDEQLEEKLRLLAEGAGARVDVDRLVEALWSLDEREDCLDPMRIAACG